MGDWPLLSLVTFLPLVGAAFIFLVRGEPEVVARNARSVALWTSLVTFLLSLLVWGNFDPTQAGYQLVEKATGCRAWASATTWASTASRSGSCCSAPCSPWSASWAPGTRSSTG
jgi:NADH:ubiquinone oxidoreductase subunit 4 (subunit M)